jgi:hypothetical protein
MFSHYWYVPLLPFSQLVIPVVSTYTGHRTTQVIKGLVNLTAAGVFSSWYFFAPNVPRYPTWLSFRRGISTSFGSVCLGSLVLSCVRILRFFSGKKTLCLGLLFNRIFSRIFQLFNRYAFTQIAIYGTTFCESAKATWYVPFLTALILLLLLSTFFLTSLFNRPLLVPCLRSMVSTLL